MAKDSKFFSHDDSRELLIVGCGHSDSLAHHEHPKDHFVTIDSEASVKPDLTLDLSPQTISSVSEFNRRFNAIIFERFPFATAALEIDNFTGWLKNKDAGIILLGFKFNYLLSLPPESKIFFIKNCTDSEYMRTVIVEQAGGNFSLGDACINFLNEAGNKKVDWVDYHVSPEFGMVELTDDFRIKLVSLIAAFNSISEEDSKLSSLLNKIEFHAIGVSYLLTQLYEAQQNIDETNIKIVAKDIGKFIQETTEHQNDELNPFFSDLEMAGKCMSKFSDPPTEGEINEVSRYFDHIIDRYYTLHETLDQNMSDAELEALRERFKPLGDVLRLMNNAIASLILSSAKMDPDFTLSDNPMVRGFYI